MRKKIQGKKGAQGEKWEPTVELGIKKKGGGARMIKLGTEGPEEGQKGERGVEGKGPVVFEGGGIGQGVWRTWRGGWPGDKGRAEGERF